MHSNRRNHFPLRGRLCFLMNIRMKQNWQ